VLDRKQKLLCEGCNKGKEQKEVKEGPGNQDRHEITVVTKLYK